MAKTPVPSISPNQSRLYEDGQLLQLGRSWYTVVGRADPSGSGDVYFLVAKKDDSACAVKVFRPVDESTIAESADVAREIADKFRARFKFEGRVLKKMSKLFPDCFPKFLGSGEQDGNPYYLMERLEPIRMQDMLRLSNDESRKRYVCDVCDAVSALHGEKLVHFDIKPNNILKRQVDGVTRYVLGDFGSVHRAETHDAKEDLRSMNRLSDGRHLQARTIGFKDPMDDKYTVHADIYALGQVIRNMFAEHVPVLWSQIILKCISNNFEYRYRSVDEIKRDILNMERRGPAMLSSALSELMSLDSITWTAERRWLYVSCAATRRETGSKDCPYKTIQAAIDAAKDEDIVKVLPGTYQENVVLEGKKIWLVSTNGAKQTVIEAADRFKSVVTLRTGADESLVEGFTITGGNGNPDNPHSSYGKDYYGGGFNCRVSCMIRDCLIFGNGQGVPQKTSCTFGGAIYVSGATVRVNNCLVENNYAWASGGALLADGLGSAVVMSDCTIRGNDSYAWSFGHQGGLSLANEAVLSVSKSLVYGNGGDQIGAFGATHANGTRAQIERSYVEGGARACNISLFLPRSDNYRTMEDAVACACGCGSALMG